MRDRLTLLLLVALAACGKAEPVLGPGESLAAGDSAVASLYRAGLSFGATRLEVSRRLGRPDSTSIAPSPNRHDTTATDTVRFLGFGRLAYIFLQPARAQHEFLLQVETGDPGRPDLRPILIGRTPAGEVRTRLGEPSRTDTLADTLALWYTNPGEAADDMVGLYLLHDTLRLVRWVPYVD